MPQKRTVDEYTFYFVPDDTGKYIWKNVVGNVFRRKIGTMTDPLEKEVEPLYAISNVEDKKTGINLLVYEIFEDLRKEIDGDSSGN
ncbi:hypothetical protein AC477_00125 [miscellaneous Crenarchaeota group-1 archaeon SG8-32-1]|uniref:Uncharacterized protein n=1 Tax=miscellaneous Crenarchaeota group-1 archaeon SG8-32-1 TaxID=1685124 RepID=A0A0M0C2S6_9ARCH|nr:MAG: hypothetical protein AC477_00125 [miscellaneous Crenarchaeota group-1 archaeon SG8-32-1]